MRKKIPYPLTKMATSIEKISRQIRTAENLLDSKCSIMNKMLKRGKVVQVDIDNASRHLDKANINLKHGYTDNFAPLMFAIWKLDTK